MKKFTNVFTEANIIPTSKQQKSVTADIQPGNAYPGNGVTNHYTPVENILTNVRNLFCTRAGVVASIAEDGVSIKLNSTKFINKQEIQRVLYEPFNTSAFNNDMGIATYIQSQGLDKMTIVDLGQYSVVYFSPSDMPKQTSVPAPTQEIVGQTIAVENYVIIPEEMNQYNIFEAEIDTINEATDDDEEIQETTRKQIIEIIKSKDKVKAAKQLAVLIGNSIELPQDYYFAGVNMQNNEQAIALRWRYLKKRPHNKTTEIKRSLMYFFDLEKDGIWVGDFDKDAMFHLPKEVEDLIHNILDLVGAKETSDPCVWSLADAEEEVKKDDEKKDDEKKDDEKKDDEKKSDEKKDDEKKSDDKQDDNEDDKSRGDNSDSLL